FRPLQHQTRYGMVAIDKPGMTVTSTVHTVLNVPWQEIERVELDPTHYLNKLLREVMLSGDPTMQIPSEIVYGFANCGHTFYSTFNSVFTLKGRLLRADLKYPSHLVMEGNGGQVWIRTPKSRREQMYHFLFHLRQTMRWLALNPIGQKTITREKEIARMLVSLPRRAAFVRSGDD